MKKISLGTALALMGVTAAVTVSVTYVYAMENFNSKVADINARQTMYAKLSEMDQRARRSTISVIDEAALRDGICAGYVAGLGDPQAKYLSAQAYKDYLEQESGKSVGVGIETARDDDGNMRIVEVLPGSSAEKSGLQKGDVIVSMDGKEIVRLTYGAALTKLDGPAGSTVRFSVLRAADAPDGSEKLEFTITRAEYDKQSVDFSMLAGQVGYIRVSAFTVDADLRFNDAVKALVNQGAVGLVLDLRNNAGGDVEIMANALDTLLPSGDTVVYRDSTGEKNVLCSSGPNAVALPVSVLINSSTYGAAEIFAANIKDYKKGLLVGAKTAGYGTRSEAYPLSDGSAVILSIAEYLRLDGAPIHGSGVEADVKKDLSEDQEASLLQRELLPEADPQVQAGIAALVRQGAPVQSSQSPSSPPGEGGNVPEN